MLRPRQDILRDPFMLEEQRTFDSYLGTLPAFNSQARGANIPRPAQSQNYISDQRGHETSVQAEARNYDKYEFPTRVEGRFARAMSSIACEPITNVTGSGGQDNNLGNNFHQEVQQALAIKLNLKTRQHANERVLRGLLRTGGRCGTLKEAVQARAAIYDEIVDPSMFVKGKNIADKAKTVEVRRKVRSQLVGAPLVVAQTGLQSIVGLLSRGDKSVLNNLRLGDRLTVAEVLKALNMAPPLTVMKLLNLESGTQLESRLGQLLAELDFTQAVSDLVALRDQLNPSMDAVAEAFKRRNLSGVFLKDNQNLSLQALMFSLEKSGKDSDLLTAEIKNTDGRGPSNRICYAYQQGVCRWAKCIYQHRCSLCNKFGHGKWQCYSNPTKGNERGPTDDGEKKTGRGQDKGVVPPNPRYRRDRN